MNKIEKSIRRNAFNEEDLLNRIQANHHDRKSYSFFGGNNMKKKVGIALVSLALVFAVWFGFNQNNVVTEEPVIMLVGIDINPSFELSVNVNDKVVEIEALNDDAKTITVSDLIGLDVDDAVEEIIVRSAQAGFIDVIDLEEDYVVISTVSLHDDLDEQDEMEEQLKLRIRDSEFLQSLNIVQIKATQREKFEADEKNVPIGLYVINGYVQQEDGTFLSAKEFFSDPENKDKISNRSDISLENQEKLKTRIEKALGKMEDDGFVGTEYRLRLENATYEQLIQIQAELKVEAKNQEKNEGSDNSDDSNKPTDPGNSNKPSGNSDDDDDDDADDNSDDDSANVNQNQNGSDSGRNN